MGELTIPAGETTTVPAGETLEAGPINLDGTLVLDGTADIGEHIFAGSAAAGATATGALSKEKDVVGSAQAGADALDPLLPGAKDVLVSVDAGVTTTPHASGTKAVLSSAESGASVVGVVESFRPLIRSNSVGIDNSRRTEFDTQGVGDVDD